MNPTLQELIDKGSKLKANKPSQYFLDKTEAQLVQQTVKNIVNQSNLDYLHTKFKKAKPPVTLTASTNPSNPFSQDVLLREERATSKQKVRQTYNQFQQKPEEIEQAEEIIKQLKPESICLEMEKTLNCEGYKVDYGNLIIKKKREAYFTKNGIEMTPMQFEAPHVIIKQKDDMYGYVTEPGNVEFLDSRIPKLVKKQIEQQELEETQNRMRQEQETATTKSREKIKKIATGEDPLDTNSSCPVVLQATQKMMINVRKINGDSLTNLYYNMKDCKCHCHQKEKHTQKVCLNCFCQYNEDLREQDGIVGLNRIQQQSNNLLRNVNIPLYKGQQENILLNQEGHITEELIDQMVELDQKILSPSKKLIRIAQQQAHLAERLWNPRLRSDIAPMKNASSVQQSILEYKQNSLLQQIDLNNMNIQQQVDIQCQLTMNLQNSLMSSPIQQQKRNFQQEDLRIHHKLNRVVDEEELLLHRKDLNPRLLEKEQIMQSQSILLDHQQAVEIINKRNEQKIQRLETQQQLLLEKQSTFQQSLLKTNDLTSVNTKDPIVDSRYIEYKNFVKPIQRSQSPISKKPVSQLDIKPRYTDPRQSNKLKLEKQQQSILLRQKQNQNKMMNLVNEMEDPSSLQRAAENAYARIAEVDNIANYDIENGRTSVNIHELNQAKKRYVYSSLK